MKKIIIALLSISLAFSSCKKDPVEEPKPEKKLKTIELTSTVFKTSTAIGQTGYKQDYTVTGKLIYDDNSTKNSSVEVSTNTLFNVPASVENAYLPTTQPQITKSKSVTANKVKESFVFTWPEFVINASIERDSISATIEQKTFALPSLGYINIKYLGAVSGSNNKIAFQITNSESSLNKNIEVVLVPAQLSSLSEKSFNLNLLSTDNYRLSYVVQQTFSNNQTLEDAKSTDLTYSVTKPSAEISLNVYELPQPSIAETEAASAPSPQNAQEIVPGNITNTSYVQKFTVTLGSVNFDINIKAYNLKYSAGNQNINLTSPKHTLVYKEQRVVSTNIVETEVTKLSDLVFTKTINGISSEVLVRIKQVYALGDLVSQTGSDLQILTIDITKSKTSFLLTNTYQFGETKETLETEIKHSIEYDTLYNSSFGLIIDTLGIASVKCFNLYSGSGTHVLPNEVEGRIYKLSYQSRFFLEFRHPYLATSEIGARVYINFCHQAPRYRKFNDEAIYFLHEEIEYVKTEYTVTDMVPSTFISGGWVWRQRQLDATFYYKINGVQFTYQLPPIRISRVFHPI